MRKRKIFLSVMLSVLVSNLCLAQEGDLITNQLLQEREQELLEIVEPVREEAYLNWADAVSAFDCYMIEWQSLLKAGKGLTEEEWLADSRFDYRELTRGMVDLAFQYYGQTAGMGDEAFNGGLRDVLTLDHLMWDKFVERARNCRGTTEHINRVFEEARLLAELYAMIAEDAAKLRDDTLDRLPDVVVAREILVDSLYPPLSGIARADIRRIRQPVLPNSKSDE